MLPGNQLLLPASENSLHDVTVLRIHCAIFWSDALRMKHFQYGKGLSTLDAYALRHGHSTIFPHAVKYVKNASLSTLDPFAASVSTRFFCF